MSHHMTYHIISYHILSYLNGLESCDRRWPYVLAMFCPICAKAPTISSARWASSNASLQLDVFDLGWRVYVFDSDWDMRMKQYIRWMKYMYHVSIRICRHRIYRYVIIFFQFITCILWIHSICLFYIDWHGHTIHKSLCVLVLFAYDSTIISSTKPP